MRHQRGKARGENSIDLKYHIDLTISNAVCFKISINDFIIPFNGAFGNKCRTTIDH